MRATHCAVIVTDDEGADLLRGLDLGVAAMLRWYETELRRTMALCGADSIDAINRDLVRRTPGWALT